MNKGFFLGTFVFPFLLWVAFPLLLAKSQETSHGTNSPLNGKIVFFDPAGAVVQAAGIEFSAPQIQFERVIDEKSVAKYKQEVAQGKLLAFINIPPDFLAHADQTGQSGYSGEATMYFCQDLKSSHLNSLRDMLFNSIKRARFAKAKLDYDDILIALVTPPVTFTAVDRNGAKSPDNSRNRVLMPLAFLALLAFSVIFSGQRLLASSLEDKSTKIVEVLLSAVSPLELLTGRILAQGLVSVLVLGSYGALGLASLAHWASLSLITPSEMVCLTLFFPMAYLYVAAGIAITGAFVDNMQEAQSFLMPMLIVVLVIPLLLMQPIINNPSGTLAVATIFIPPFIPYVVMIRSTVGVVPAWHLALALVIGYAGVGVALWMAARVFRISILIQGRIPSPREMLRWITQG